MARIAIIALMLFAAAPALAQQSDTTAPVNGDAMLVPANSTVAAPQAAPRPACGESIGGLSAAVLSAKNADAKHRLWERRDRG